MSISATAAALDARIQNFKTSAESADLQERARNIATDLSARVDKLRTVGELMQCLRVEDPVDRDPVRVDIKEFQQQLAQAGLKAVQQPTAAALSASVRDLTDKTDAKGKRVWKDLFSGLTEEIKARVGRLGLSAADRKATGALTKVEGARLRYPGDNWEEIKGILGDDCSKWREKVNGLIAKLIADLDHAEKAVAQRSEEVQDFIATASSTDGFSLKDLTTELLDELRAIGIEDDYTIRPTA